MDDLLKKQYQETISIERNGELFLVDVNKNELDDLRYTIAWSVALRKPSNLLEYDNVYKDELKDYYQKTYGLSYPKHINKKQPDKIFSSW